MQKRAVKLVVGSAGVLLATIAIGLGLASFKRWQIQQAMAAGGPPPPSFVVTTAPVESISFRQSSTSVGTVMAPRWIGLRNEVSGAIVKMEFQSGQIVEQGQVLIELDKAVELASLEAAKARHAIADSTYRRNYKIAASEAVSALELEQSEGELRQAKAEINRLEAIIAKKTMHAPFRAQVGILNVNLGQYLSEGTEITTLQGIDDYVFVDFMLPQSIADQVEENEEVEIEHRGHTLVGKIVAFDSRADRSTRNLLVRARLDQPPKELSPNDSVRVETPYGPEVHAQSIPVEALRRTPSGAHVFIVEQDQQGNAIASERVVLPGRAMGTRLAILSGLTELDRVITDGSFKLQDGALISDAVATQSAKTQAESDKDSGVTSDGIESQAEITADRGTASESPHVSEARSL